MQRFVILTFCSFCSLMSGLKVDLMPANVNTLSVKSQSLQQVNLLSVSQKTPDNKDIERGSGR
jgi:hypothetical protein